jgi:hypothetical protein
VSILCCNISSPFLMFSVVRNYNFWCGTINYRISEPRDHISVLWHILELCIRLGSMNISVPFIQSTYRFYIYDSPKSQIFNTNSASELKSRRIFPALISQCIISRSWRNFMASVSCRSIYIISANYSLVCFLNLSRSEWHFSSLIVTWFSVCLNP